MTTISIESAKSEIARLQKEFSGLATSQSAVANSLPQISVGTLPDFAGKTATLQAGLTAFQAELKKAFVEVPNIGRVRLDPYAALLQLEEDNPKSMFKVINLNKDNIKVSEEGELLELYLHDKQVSDISAIAGLTSLEKLYLNDNQILDISALAGLTSLENLDLNNNQISDISVVASLTSLKWLYLSNNKILDISSLAGLTSLKELNLSNNKISDISAVANLTSLKWLFLRRNNISDFNALDTLQARGVNIEI